MGMDDSNGSAQDSQSGRSLFRLFRKKLYGPLCTGCK
jgi:hypothetical protein